MSMKDKTQEQKYERVETMDVDKEGNVRMKDVRANCGQDDPGMNYKDKCPNLVPIGVPPAVGMVPANDAASIRSGSLHGPETQVRNTSIVGSTHGLIEPSLSRGGKAHIVEEHHYSSTGSARSPSDLITGSANTSADFSTGSGRASNEFSNARQVFEQESRNPSLTPSGSLPPQRDDSQRSSTHSSSSHSSTHRIEPMHSERGSMHTEKTETTITQSSHPRLREDIVVSVPVQRFESSRLESVHTGYTSTDQKPLNVTPAMMAPPIQGLSSDIMNAGSGGASATISANTNVDLSGSQIADMGPEEYDRYRQKVQALEGQFESEAVQKAAGYRAEVERDAELIRKTLEKQHIRDIEFRKDMVESAVDRQQMEIQLEAEYAMRALEQERAAAREALDKAKMQTNIDVRVDTAVGTTISKGSVTTTAEHEMKESRGYETRI